ncbi:CBS domain-containing protein [Phycisphaeraceae bacterium D3-23]
MIDLLPKEQRIEKVQHNEPVGAAIERMSDNEYSQVPVERNGEIIGLFSWRSFGIYAGERMDESALKATPVVECLAKAKFLPPDAYIDTEVEWTDQDCVLVGSPGEMIGLLAIYDVVGRLQDFGESFFLIHEVEHLLRDMLTDAVGDEVLVDMISKMTVPPGMKTQPTALTDLTFSMYGSLACSKKRWPNFESMFLGDRNAMIDTIDRVATIRNVVFHFKRPVMASDVDELRRFRDKLHQQRAAFFRRSALDT